MKLIRPAMAPWNDPDTFWPDLAAATSQLDPPFGVLSLPALAANAFSLLDRAAGTPIRVASKSVRVRGVLEAVLALPGYAGVLAYTLPEALWLAETMDDIVVGYPTTHRAALRELAVDERLASQVTLMVDSVEHLDFIDSVIPPSRRTPLRVCIELDCSWEGGVFGHVGVWRSPVYTPVAAQRLARAIVKREGFTLVGMMGYEAQVAGVTNRPPGKAARGAVIRYIQRSSIAELADRRSQAVGLVREVADLEFVNGGGTGSIESTVADASVTEVAAGSGLFGPHLFDHYTAFTPAPAASFALSVVRKPRPGLATLMGGGWIASGPPGLDRAPSVAWPKHLRTFPREGAGEVQTPLRGRGARGLALGDRVWLRHTKAGELSEHLNYFSVVDRGKIVDTLPTYRGEGPVFL
ncbi:amino acid deaminase/aldolase [Glaciihabitans sp. dw_435]|uniref:amino acid deaminase/aldolase n=1 Tax=Glaciihabitans sp. dw_435 TaxID=2720081 RepID=UPI001BD32F7B|nr:amino acid deaminase/aldolase [Glaciihabitans sp. dw_435]